MIKKLIAEFWGTYFLVLIGTGAVMLNEATNGSIGTLGIAIAFFLGVSGMIYSFGKISGAHINPAVSIGFWLQKRIESKLLLFYIPAQCLGAIAASLTLHFSFPSIETLGETLPSGSVLESFILEFFLTFALMLIILIVVHTKASFHQWNGLIIGMVVGLEAYLAGPICGASMNPARSIGPALISGNLQQLWLYVLAPILGAVLAVISFKIQWINKYFEKPNAN